MYRLCTISERDDDSILVSVPTGMRNVAAAAAAMTHLYANESYNKVY